MPEIQDVLDQTRDLRESCDDEAKVIYGLCMQTAVFPGHAAEVGVYKGGTLKVIAKSLPDKLIFGFDTFQGIPGSKVDEAVDHHRPGDFVEGATLYEVRNALMDCTNVRLIPGIFPESAEGYKLPEEYCFVHIDADLYESTKAAILYFWPKMVSGGVMLFHDYGWKNCEGVERAIRECLGEVMDTHMTKVGDFQVAFTHD